MGHAVFDRTDLTTLLPSLHYAVIDDSLSRKPLCKRRDTAPCKGGSAEQIGGRELACATSTCVPMYLLFPLVIQRHFKNHGGRRVGSQGQTGLLFFSFPPSSLLLSGPASAHETRVSLGWWPHSFFDKFVLRKPRCDISSLEACIIGSSLAVGAPIQSVLLKENKNRKRVRVCITVLLGCCHRFIKRWC